MSNTTHDPLLAIRPSPFTLYLRRCVPWQLLRFIFINLRMTVMILKSHKTRLPSTAPKH
jgi:hypothetical protein